MTRRKYYDNNGFSIGGEGTTICMGLQRIFLDTTSNLPISALGGSVCLLAVTDHRQEKKREQSKKIGESIVDFKENEKLALHSS